MHKAIKILTIILIANIALAIYTTTKLQFYKDIDDRMMNLEEHLVGGYNPAMGVYVRDMARFSARTGLYKKGDRK